MTKNVYEYYVIIPTIDEEALKNYNGLPALPPIKKFEIKKYWRPDDYSLYLGKMTIFANGHIEEDIQGENEEDFFRKPKIWFNAWETGKISLYESYRDEIFDFNLEEEENY